MSIPFKVAGRGDLDALFQGWSSGGSYGSTGHILTGYGDLGYRYQLRGGATPIAATGFRVPGGTDFASLFLGASVTPPAYRTLIVAYDAIGIGYLQGSFGTLTDPTYLTRECVAIYDWASSGATPNRFRVQFNSPVALSQTFFDRIYFDVPPGTPGSNYMATAVTSFSAAPPIYTWNWNFTSFVASQVPGANVGIRFT